MSVPLAVPPPLLTYEPIDGFFAAVEGTITVTFGAVRYPDGTAVELLDVIAARVLLTRVAGPAGIVDIWDPATRSWQLEGTADPAAIEGVPLLPPKSGSEPWTGVLVGAGQMDAAAAPLLSPAIAHFPQYRLRGVFHARRDGVDAIGISADSPALEFVSLTAAPRFGAELTPSQPSATRVRLALKNAGGIAVGFLEIDASNGDAEISLGNFTSNGTTLASVTLQADGAIRLKPAAGRKVFLDADIETGRIRYVPASGFTPQNLP